MTILEITNSNKKAEIARAVLENLPEWFGIEEAREEYIEESKEQVCFAAFEDENPLGFFCLKETGKDTMELAVLGIKKSYHRLGIGRQLFEASKKYAQDNGYSFLQVKTLQKGRDKGYDRTNLFYQSLGFKEFEVFPTLWDVNNPCQIYVMSLNNVKIE